MYILGGTVEKDGNFSFIYKTCTTSTTTVVLRSRAIILRSVVECGFGSVFRSLWNVDQDPHMCKYRIK